MAGSVILGIFALRVGDALAADLLPQYRIDAQVLLDPPRVEGTMTVSLVNTTARPLDQALVVLFPNRFASEENDKDINDFNRPYVYPREDFGAGTMEVVEARDAGQVVQVILEPSGTLPEGIVARVPIAELRPGESRTLTMRFRTVIPYRFGSFGHFDDQITLVGGWYPYLAALAPDGAWSLASGPPRADFEVNVAAPANLDVVLNGHYFPRGTATASVVVPGVRYLSLILAPDFIREEIDADGTRVVYLRRPERLSSRITFEPPFHTMMLESARDIVAHRPAALPAPPQELLLVEAPLRLLDLTIPGEGSVIVSDRALKVLWLVRPFHELQLAQGMYAEVLRPTLSAREPSNDYEWVSEGLSRTLAQRFIAQQYPDTRSVYDWIDLFNIFAIVDRFESEPKIPFVHTFFDRARVVDPLYEEVMTFTDHDPPGRVLLAQLHDLLGPSTFATVIDRCASDARPFRLCATAVSGRDLSLFFSDWRQPYPRLNYDIEAIDLNTPSDGEYQHTVTIGRQASRPVEEAVMIRLRSIGGREVDVWWDSREESGTVSVTTPFRAWQAVIDPDRRVIEDRRDDNAYPFAPQLVFDSAEVEVSSTEFGISTLLVGRNRYDYHKDLAFTGFYTDRGIGFTAGARAHWGTPIDPTRFRHNIYGFYVYESLDSGFIDQRQPSNRTSGKLGGLGVRYDYTNVFSFDNPSRERALRIYGDWFDSGLGSDYNYGDWGFILTLTQPLWSYRTIIAGQVINGFSEPIGNSQVPNQGLYSLGGTRAIRGIGVEDELARNTVIARAELRQDVFPEVDLNFLDLLILRRGQLRAFVDTGRVSNSAGQIYDVGKYAVGVGIGFAAVYDFMGFFPSMAYLELATRVDESDELSDIQVLFGTRQAF